MRVIVAGSRTITDEAVVRTALREAFLFEAINPTLVLSGCVRGVDTVGAVIARKSGVRVVAYPANWAEHGRRAGFIRNVDMAHNADALVAVWDGGSKGTEHMIQAARERGLSVYVKIVK